jgi:hypothetical protein
VIEGTGDNAVARLVVYDNKAHRASAVDAKNVLTLRATKKPISWTLVGGIAGLLIVILLLVLVLARGGGGGRRRGGGQPPPPPMPPPGYGMPPGGYGAAPPPGGATAAYPADRLGPTAAVAGGAMMAAQAPAATPQGLYAMHPAHVAAQAPPAAMAGGAPVAIPPAPAQPRDFGPGASGAIVQVRCPSCGLPTMATPGQPSVCFSCGQPIAADLTADLANRSTGLALAAGPAYASTGAAGAQALVPPPNPYGHPASSATIRSASGHFVIRGGAEVRVGRDPAQCSIFLAEPRVSGVHATLKFESGSLAVRDESSNNGTWVSGARLLPGVWTTVPAGTPLRFGPVEFAVQLDA